MTLASLVRLPSPVTEAAADIRARLAVEMPRLRDRIRAEVAEIMKEQRP